MRQAMSEQGTVLPHAAALELLARQHGMRNWNTLFALAERPVAQSLPFAVGARVKGSYLRQPFEGKVLSLSTLPGGKLFKIVIEFDTPVEVVTFERFSAYRRRITAQIDENGISPRKTSDGVSHLVLNI